MKIMKLVGFTATPGRWNEYSLKIFHDYICETKAGYGAFSEFAELIIII